MEIFSRKCIQSESFRRRKRNNKNKRRKNNKLKNVLIRKTDYKLSNLWQFFYYIICKRSAHLMRKWNRVHVKLAACQRFFFSLRLNSVRIHRLHFGRSWSQTPDRLNAQKSVAKSYLWNFHIIKSICSKKYQSLYWIYYETSHQTNT